MPIELAAPAITAKREDRPTDFLRLTDDELYTALDAAVSYRNTKLEERSRLNLPSVLLPESDLTPKPHTLEWQILQAESLVTRFFMELTRRDPSLLETLCS